MAKTKKPVKSKNNLTGVGLALMAFTGVWSFGNICNGFGYFGGTQVILPWLAVFVLYFLPYSLMVGELGSVFKKDEGGVGVWCFKTIGPKVAFFAGWIYWVVHMPYLTQKSNMLVVALNWIFNPEGTVKNMDVTVLQLLCLAVFLLALFLSIRGADMVKSISKIAGIAIFVMMFLYIVMIFAAPLINPSHSGDLRSFDLTRDGLWPNDLSLLMNMSILILAVGGCEKFAPYVKSMKDPGKGFPKGMILLVIMVFATAVLGTFAMNSFYDGQEILRDNADFLANGQYQAFCKLGYFFGLGDWLMYAYALSNALAQFAAIIISIDAPLRILLGNADTDFIPRWWLKKNKYGSYPNGILVVGIIVTVITVIPCLGLGDANGVVKWLIDINSICMPIRYLFVFAAYMALKAQMSKFPNEDYALTKSKGLGMFIGFWCFAITAAAIIMKMTSAPDVFQLIMNCGMPFILCGIGLLMPLFARRSTAKWKASLKK